MKRISPVLIIIILFSVGVAIGFFYCVVRSNVSSNANKKNAQIGSDDSVMIVKAVDSIQYMVSGIPPVPEKWSLTDNRTHFWINANGDSACNLEPPPTMPAYISDVDVQLKYLKACLAWQEKCDRVIAFQNRRFQKKYGGSAAISSQPVSRKSGQPRTEKLSVWDTSSIGRQDPDHRDSNYFREKADTIYGTVNYQTGSGVSIQGDAIMIHYEVWQCVEFIYPPDTAEHFRASGYCDLDPRNKHDYCQILTTSGYKTIQEKCTFTPAKPKQ